MFIGEEKFRESKVAIFNNVKNYSFFKKWFSKNISLQTNSNNVFFTIVNPSRTNKPSHYMGVKLYKNKIVFFDPAEGILNKNTNGISKNYIQKLATELNLKFIQFKPTVKCQTNKNDIFCQTWTVMWNYKIKDTTTPKEATIIFKGKKYKIKNKFLYPNKNLFQFVKEFITKKSEKHKRQNFSRNRKSLFNSFFIEQLEIDTSLELQKFKKNLPFYKELFNIFKR